jgi:hypothetical protein
MLNLASLAMVLLATARPVTDTTITVKAGTRLVVDNFAGAINVTTWTKNAIRIQAEHSRRAELDIDHGLARLDVSAHGKWGEPVFADYTITVPSGTPLELSGIDTDIEVQGGEGPVKAETVKGDVTIRGAKGSVSCSSVEGEVQVADCRGRVEASAVNDMVRVVGATGEVQAESVNGDVFLEQAKTASVEASTVNGNVYFIGDIRNDGDYSFSTHQGNLWVGVPVNAGCSGSVSTYEGSFNATFPLERSDKKKRGNDFTFTIGNGSARLELEAFNGSIRLARPAEVTERVTQVHARRAEREKARAYAKDSDSREKELERKMEAKERELERKMEQQDKAKDKNDEDDGDHSPDPDPDVN